VRLPCWSGFKEYQGRSITLGNTANLWLRFIGSSDPNTYEFILAQGTYSIDYLWQETGHAVPTEDSEGFEDYQTYSVKFAFKELERSDNTYAGGTRIKKITHIDGNKKTVREYKYVRNYFINHTDTASSGILGTLPLYNYSIGQYNPNLTGYYNLASSQSLVESSLTDGSPVGYSDVAEIIKDGQGNILGYTTYKYSNFDTNPDAGPTNALSVIARDLFARRKNDMERGKLLSKKEYSSSNTLLKQTNYTYQQFTRGNNINGIKCEGLFSDCDMDKRLLAYTVSAYLIYNKSYLPIVKTETIYDVNGQNPVTTSTNYTYDSYDQVRQADFTVSDGSIRKQEMKYPADFTVAPYPAMVAKNILGSVVESSVYRGASLIEKTAGDYSLLHNSFYAPVNSKYQKGSGNMEIRATYLYDTKGNVREEIKNDADRTVYLWSYNYQHPVAKIENAAYSQVEQILTSQLVSRVASANEPAANDLNAIKNLRTTLSGAMVTVYEYKPLVGISKVTDQRGVVTEYVYDDFGRLKHVSVDGKKETEYQYHYKQ
jgi:YD repeat-containing protein